MHIHYSSPASILTALNSLQLHYCLCMLPTTTLLAICHPCPCGRLWFPPHGAAVTPRAVGQDGTAPFRAQRAEDAALSPAHKQGSFWKPRGGDKWKQKSPFPAQDPFLCLLGCERGGWPQPPWTQRGRGDALGLRRRVLPPLSPGETKLGATETAQHRRLMVPLCARSLVRHSRSQGEEPAGRAYCSSGSSRKNSSRKILVLQETSL